MIISLILFFLLLISLIVLSWTWPPDSPWAPWWRTNKKTARKMCELAKVGKDDIVYDLGSGDGTTLLVAAKEFGAKGIGIEIDPLRVLLSKLHIYINGYSKKVIIKRKNFFAENISSATVVFLYLIPKALEKLKPKLLSELKPGSRVVTVTYKIPGGLTNRRGTENERKILGIKNSLQLYGMTKKDNREIFLYIIPQKS